jgi:1-acyl-sn-glycerol-3-phosphate acyltransferase
MIGGFEFQPPGRITPRLTIRPGVRFGPALDFSRYYGMETDRIVLRAVTDEIIYEIMKLSGQEYVDEYAQRHKSRGKRSSSATERDEPGAGDREEPDEDAGAASSDSASRSAPAEAGPPPAAAVSDGASITDVARIDVASAD